MSKGADCIHTHTHPHMQSAMSWCALHVQDKRALQQQLSSELSARTAAEQQVQVLQRQVSSASAECTNCKQV